MQTTSSEETSITTQKDYKISSVLSRDGTSIGFRQYGHGPGLVLVQGAMGVAQHFSALAEALSDAFTVYVPDRRGRGMSPGLYQREHSIQRDVEDLEALLTKTEARNVFGLSSGALISLTAAARLSGIEKLAIFEPPLFSRHPFPRKEVLRFEQAISEGNFAKALTAAGKAVQLVPALKYVPGWLLTFLINRVMSSEDKLPPGDYPTMRQIAPTLQYDLRIVSEVHGQLESWRAIPSEVLLLGGNKSPAYLRADLETIAEILPRAKRVTLAGLDHGASWNQDKRRNPYGAPAQVASALKAFFARS